MKIYISFDEHTFNFLDKPTLIKNKMTMNVMGEELEIVTKKRFGKDIIDINIKKWYERRIKKN